MHTLLAIKGHIYEASHFIDKHPGEGINNVYLNEHNRKEVTALFNKFHQSDESEEHLIKAREGTHDKIKYIGPNYFQKRLPRYYHYVEDVESIDLTKFPARSYFMFPSLDIETRDNTLNLYVVDGMRLITVHHLKLDTIEDEDKNKYLCGRKLVRCYVEVCDTIDEEKNVKTCTIEAPTIEEFIDTYFTKQKYEPIHKIEYVK